MKNRIPILSFLLSFIFSGLGQVYNGELIKGIILLILIFPIYIILGLTGIISKFYGFILIIAAILIYKLFIGIEAYRTANHVRSYELKPINKIWKYLLFILFGSLVNWAGIKTSRVLIGYESFEIPMSSMEPTINIGDKIIATKIKLENVKIGDVITFKREDGQIYLSRVVGLQNQKVKIENNRAVVDENPEIWTENKKTVIGNIEYQVYNCNSPNGRTYQTKLILKLGDRDFPEQETTNMKEIMTPPNEVFVLGDKRNDSMDSRLYGTVSFENITNKVNYIWWSKDKTRIGKRIDK